MNSSLWTYDVRIIGNTALLKVGPLSNSIPNCGEIIITSKQFTTYDICEKSLSGLLSVLSKFESITSNKNQVIVTKINPLLESESTEWESNIVLRAYIADAEQLKKANLSYHVVGQIMIDHQMINHSPPPYLN